MEHTKKRGKEKKRRAIKNKNWRREHFKLFFTMDARASKKKTKRFYSFFFSNTGNKKKKKEEDEGGGEPAAGRVI